MRPDTKKLLYDISKACRLIADFTAGKTYADYDNDALLRSGVERQFEIIGEALNQAKKLEPGLADRIIDLPRIVSFRNLLIHGYAVVDNKVVWDIIQKNLPRLSTEVASLMD